MKSLAKFLTALMLGVMVILGAGTLTVNAAGWEAPFWGDLSKGECKWRLSDDYKNYSKLVFELYKDGEKFTSYWFTPDYIYSEDGCMSAQFGFVIDRSGSYTVKVLGYVPGHNSLNDDEYIPSGTESPFSDAFNYVLPEAKLATPSNLRWETTESTISATCDAVEGADEYYFTLYRDGNYVATHVTRGSRNDFSSIINETPGEYTFTAKATAADILAYSPSETSEFSVAYGENQSNVDPSTLDCKWYSEGGKSFWYEGGVRQGTYDDPKGVEGDGTIRGREIFDPATNAWYWLDANADGAKAVGKEVWMPYIYQNEKDWDDEEKRRIANESDPGMEDLVYDYMLHGIGKWVRYDEKGRMLKGWVIIEGPLAEKYQDQENNVYYYDNRTGLMAKGYITLGGTLFHFDEITGVLDEIEGQPFVYMPE